MARSTMKNVELNMTILNGEEQEKYAEQFSEGSPALKKLLLYLWQNDINTFACCAGHSGDTKLGSFLMASNKPYIFFDVQNLNDGQFENLLVRLSAPQNIGDKMRFDYLVSHDYYGQSEKERTALTLYFKTINEENFEYLLRNIKAVKDNRIMKFDLIKDELDREYVKWTYACTNLTSNNVRDFIDSAVRLKNISMEDYMDCNDDIKYSSVTMKYTNSLQASYETSDNLIKNNISIIDENTGLVQISTLVKGYATKMPDGKWCTTTDGKDCVELSIDEANNMPKYNKENKYNIPQTKFSQEKFEPVLSEIETYNVEMGV